MHASDADVHTLLAGSSLFEGVPSDELTAIAAELDANGMLRSFLLEHPQLAVTLLHQVVRRFRSVVTSAPAPAAG